MRQDTIKRHTETLGKVFAALVVLTVTVPLFSARFGNLPRLMVWLGWIQTAMYAMTLTQAATRIETIRRHTKTMVGWVDWRRPPYPALFRNMLGTFVAMVIMLGFAFNFFGQMNFPTQKHAWIFFGTVTLVGLYHYANTGVIVNRVDGIIHEVESLNAPD